MTFCNCNVVVIRLIFMFITRVLYDIYCMTIVHGQWPMLYNNSVCPLTKIEEGLCFWLHYAFFCNLNTCIHIPWLDKMVYIVCYFNLFLCWHFIKLVRGKCTDSRPAPSTRHYCNYDNFQMSDFWIYCPTLGVNEGLVRRELWIPQSCSCYNWNCYMPLLEN